MDEQLEKSAKFYQSVDGVALMILMMDPDVGAEILKSFSYDEVTRITHAMSKIEDVNVPEASAGIAGFFRDFKEHSGIVASTRGNISDLLEAALGGGLARNLVSEIYGDDIGLKAGRLEYIPADLLAKELQDEHIDLQAMLFAHLKPAHASEVLKFYPEALAHRVMYGVSRKSMITTSQVDTILGLIERCESNYLTTRSKTVDGLSATASILNRFDGNKASFFEFVRDQDAIASDEIEERMVDFGTLFTQSIETLETINETVTIELWAMALKGAPDEHRDFIMNSMPTRLGAELKDNIHRLGAVPTASVEEARTEILKIVRKLGNDGDLTLTIGSGNMVM